ncbi:protein mono-ADP-ribosyltransferase PARP10-like, partial [Rhinophrynus dorsalis]
DIKVFASLLKYSETEGDETRKSKDLLPSSELSTEPEHTELDIYTDQSPGDSNKISPMDEELDQACKMSQDEYQDKELDEEAQLLLAIQRSMDTQKLPTEDEELQKVLEMSLRQQVMEDSEESLQKALEMSLRQQFMDETDESLQVALERSLRQEVMEETEESMQAALERSLRDEWIEKYGDRYHNVGSAEASSLGQVDRTVGTARITVLGGDETSLVVACTALRKAVTGELCTETLEGVQHLCDQQVEILFVLQRKHGVKITVTGGQAQIQGFTQPLRTCRQELVEILKFLKGKTRTPEHMEFDIQHRVELCPLVENSEEYAQVTQTFYSTLQELKNSIEILEVQRVLNVLLYNQYELKKKSMLAHGAQRPIERILYHGTTESSAREICHYGFNRSFCGKNAALYGQGVYFAVQSVLSSRDNYSPPSSDGKKFVLVAQVLTGEFTVGKANMRAPPPLPENTGEAPRRYDSLADSICNPSIFVIFNDTQAYPKYLITCCKGGNGRH